MNISVIIPTYNNTDQLIHNLKQNLLYLNGCQVIIVNDYPGQSIKKDMKQFPDVQLIENTTNLGFSGTMNTGVKQAARDYVLFLNDDVLLNNDSYKKALKHFEQDQKLFAISFAQKEKNGEITGKNKIFWKNGFFQHSKANSLEFGPNGWAEGGSSLIDKGKFEKLGGFDTLYSPFYWEDIDLSYRAWKKGYQVLFDPEVLVEHHHESTIGKQFKKSKITTIAYRNQFIFIWKNMSTRLLIDHGLHLMTQIIKAFVRGDLDFLTGASAAASKLPTVLANRSSFQPQRDDQTVFTIFQVS